MNKNKKVFMWYKVNELWNTGLNKSQISRELGIDRCTVRKYLNMNEASFVHWIKQPRNLPKKLSPYYKFVKNLLGTTPYLSAAQVEDRLKENFNDLPSVNSKTVYNFVKSIREQHDLQKCKTESVRQYQKLPEVDYGSEAQVDFGEYNMQTIKGNRRKVYFFVMVLSRSRQKYVYFQCQPFTTQTAIYAHELAFEYFKGVPHKIIYDQDRVFVNDENLGDILLTDGFSCFCQQYPFEPVFCKKADPESKGKVENVVRFVKYNFLKGRLFTDAETLQTDCLAWLERTGNTKIHSTTRKVPKQEWLIEQQYLLPYVGVPEKPLMQLPEYKVRKDNTIAYRGNFYSLPIGTYEGQQSKVLLKDMGVDLTIYTIQNELLAKHKIPFGKGLYVRNTDHSRTKSKTLRKTHETLLFELGNTQKASVYLKRLEEDKPRYYHDNIRVMLKSVSKASKPNLEQTLAFCLENRVLNGYRFVEILQYYQKQTNSESENALPDIPKIAHAFNYQEIEPKTSNINFYEKML